MNKKQGCILFFIVDLVMISLVVMQLHKGDISARTVMGEVSKGQIALTFDDGPHPVYTEKLLEGLAKRGVPATFFVTGKNVELYPEIIKKMQTQGHLIGNHTYSHMQLLKTNEAEFQKELEKTNQAIYKVTGVTTDYVRPPFGSWNKKFEKELNMFPVLWSIDPMDWCKTDVSAIVRSVVSKAEENDIILMHDSFPSSVEAALQIIDELEKKGYEFVTVEEILFD